MTGLEGACVQAMLTGAVALKNIDNHIDTQTEIVYHYPKVTYIIPNNKNMSKCKIKPTEEVKKSDLREMLFKF